MLQQKQNNNEEEKIKLYNHLLKNNWGFLFKLKSDFGSEIVDELQNSGIIHIGQKYNQTTWSLSQFGKTNIEEYLNINN